MAKLPQLRKPKAITKPLKPLKAKAVKASRADLSPIEEVEKSHLQAIADYEPITVIQFRAQTSSPDAKMVLEGYAKQGFAERIWEHSQGKFKLTETGRARLEELA